ncbi:hypothetical protein ACWGKQ_00300 [Streptomyces sp. NPDC054770]
MKLSGLSEAEIGAVFERVLDQALASGQVDEVLGHGTGGFDRERLRSRALRQRDVILATVAVEYREYLAAGTRSGNEDVNGNGGPVGRVAGAGGPAAARPRAVRGVLSALALLVPGLAAAAAGACLLVGYCLRAVEGRPYLGDGLVTAGLIAGAVAVGAAVGDLLWLLSAPRDAPAGPGHGPPGAGAELARTRHEWELALLERGMVPFLLGRIEEARLGERRDRAVR